VQKVLVVTIGVLVIYIVQMLFFSGGANKKTGVVYKPKRRPEKMFLTLEELRQYDASDPEKPILVGIRGKLYDVSAKRSMYGIKGEGYNCMAGRDASRALAKHALDEATCSNPNIDDLTPGEKEALDSWESFFIQRYEVAGEIIHSEEERQQKTAEEKKRYAEETAKLEAEEREKAAAAQAQKK
jgi:membrane-associated progesterone receptor component